MSKSDIDHLIFCQIGIVLLVFINISFLSLVACGGCARRSLKLNLTLRRSFHPPLKLGKYFTQRRNYGQGHSPVTYQCLCTKFSEVLLELKKPAVAGFCFTAYFYQSVVDKVWP